MRIRLLALLGALIALAIVGCGSSDSSESTSGQGSTSTAPALKGEPIYFGVINDATRPDGLEAPQMAEAAKVHAEVVNAAGGIKGRPLELIACDTKGDPNTATACAREMVSKKAVAVIGTTTIFEAQIFPVLEQAGIPAIATIPLSSVAHTSKVAFNFTPGIIGTFLAGPRILAQTSGVKTPSLIYPSGVPRTSAELVKIFQLGTKLAGATPGPIAGYTLGTTNFSSVAVKGTSDGVDGTFAFGAGSGQGPLIKAVKQQQPDIPIATVSETIDKTAVDFLGPQINGVYAVGMFQPATSKVPGVVQFNKELDEYSPDTLRNETAINAWAGVWLLERIAKDLPTIDAASVMKAVSNLTDFDMGGIIPPLTTTKKATSFPGLDRTFNADVIFLKVVDEQLEALDGKFIDPFPAQ